LSLITDTYRHHWVTLVTALMTAACGGSDSLPTSSTTTTTTTTTTTVASPAFSEQFSGRIAPGTGAFYSFSVTQNGTVTLTLTGISGVGVPATVWLGIGLGLPNAEDCSTTSTTNTPAGTTAQLTTTLAPGVYCARVWDIGNLAAPASFELSIAFP
jgi:hypothetical protein